MKKIITNVSNQKEKNKKKKFKDLIKKLIKEEDGMGVVEIVLIILVLVGLALIFRNQITAIANSIYDSIREQVGKF